MQLASLEVVTQSSSLIGLPQYVSLIWGLAACTLPTPLAWRIFMCDKRFGSCPHLTSPAPSRHGNAPGVAFPRGDHFVFKRPRGAGQVGSYRERTRSWDEPVAERRADIRAGGTNRRHAFPSTGARSTGRSRAGYAPPTR